VPYLAGKEWEYLKECLDTNWVSSVGPFVDRFERDMASYLNARHGIAVVTGTAALHVALLAADVGQDDEVLVPSLTFIATANAIRYCGAGPCSWTRTPRPGPWTRPRPRSSSPTNARCGATGS
jgi:dTDP-4-amino-4,6-dideoxygalactose transaminase